MLLAVSTWAANLPKLGAPFTTIGSNAVLRRPTFLIGDGAPGLEKAIAAVWDGVPVQRFHKHRNLLAHAPECLHEEIGAGYTNMIYAATCGHAGKYRSAP